MKSTYEKSRRSESKGSTATDRTGIYRPLAAIAIALVLALSLGIGQGSRTAYAADGDLDPAFDGDGKVITDFFGSNDQIFGMAIQPDGKIVGVGRVTGTGNGYSDFGVARYNTNGSLDTSFDGDGKVTTSFASNSSEEAWGVALQADGKIVAAGWTDMGNGNNVFAVARYNTNGSLDTSFDSDGMATADFGGGFELALAMAILPDGKIVVGGRSSPDGFQTDFALARFNTNGSLDTSFDGDGKVTSNVGVTGSLDVIHALLAQPDGKIVAAGEAWGNTSDLDFVVARYNTNGALDASFDANGVVTTTFGTSDVIYGAALQPDGKIVVVGKADDASYEVFGLARYNTDGGLDGSFDGDGKLTTSFAYYANAKAVALQTDGKIVVAGDAGTSTAPAFALTRYNSNGSIDITFDGDGKVITHFGNYGDYPYDVEVQADGKIVAAGYHAPDNTSGRYEFALARYTSLQGGACNVQFTDVPLGHTFYEHIHCLFCRAYINGYPCGGAGEPCNGNNDPYFRSNNNVTRGQLSKIVSNSAGFFEIVPSDRQSFQDVPTNHSFWPYIERLYSRGMVSGYPCGGVGEPCGPGNLPYFRTNGSASRGQISKIVALARGWTDPVSSQAFEDVAAGSTFHVWIENLASRGVMQGYPCGGPGEPCGTGNRPYFRPGSLATRGQTSKIAVNTFFPGCPTP